MYLQHFRLTKKPFEINPDSEFYFAARSHALGFSVLQYSLKESPSAICLITGEVGSGKTMLIKRLLLDLDPTVQVGIVTNTHHVFGDALCWIGDAFGIAPLADGRIRHRDLEAYLEQLARQNRRALLIIDEAQNLSEDDLEAVRVLTNGNVFSERHLQIILVGQPELARKLDTDSLRQLLQRVSVGYALKPLDRRETCDYIAHRLSQAGGNRTLFSDAALNLVYQASSGVPRVINTLCDLALVYAFVDRLPRVSSAVISDVIREKTDQGLYWLPDGTDGCESAAVSTTTVPEG